LVARDAVTGKPLWRARIGNVSNAAQTDMLDRRQDVLVASGERL
jgi:alcohol dehydrogenase (cytochrome c)